ncbi:MAG: dCTP deaminase [Thermoplasmata archaeon]|nr:dCTP deaminase [Thermoplasmata archaeon]
MSILSDRDIQEALGRGDMDIEPFSEEALTPNGYDLSIAEVLLPDTGHRFLEGVAMVPPMTRFMVSTRERVRLGPALTAQLWLRTTWARRGVLAAFGKIDAGFDGTLTFAAFNTSMEAQEVTIGETFAQLVVEAMSGPAEAVYAKRSGNYQDQRGVTMAREMEADDGEGIEGHTSLLVAPCLEMGCNECCLETEMPLTGTDVERLAGLGHDPAAFTLLEDGFTFLTNVEGRCYCRDHEGRCSAYEDRPEGCCLYPLVLSEDMADFNLDHLCPHRAFVQPEEGHRTALLQLLDLIARERQ